MVRSPGFRPFGPHGRADCDHRHAALFRTPLTRTPVSAVPHGRVSLPGSPPVANPLVRFPVFPIQVVRRPFLGSVPPFALRSFGPARKIPLRPGVRTAIRWTTHARTPDPRTAVSRSPCPCSPSPWSPCFGSSRPFAIRSLPTLLFGLRSFAGALFRSPAFPGGLESPETGCSVRPKARIKSYAGTRTRDLQVPTLAS